MYSLSDPSDSAEFDRKVEDWDAKCYQATVELVAPAARARRGDVRRFPRAIYGAMEHVEVHDEEYDRQRFVDVFQIGWTIECEYWEEEG